MHNLLTKSRVLPKTPDTSLGKFFNNFIESENLCLKNSHAWSEWLLEATSMYLLHFVFWLDRMNRHIVAVSYSTFNI